MPRIKADPPAAPAVEPPADPPAAPAVEPPADPRPKRYRYDRGKLTPR